VEIPVHELHINDGVLELATDTNHADGVPAEDAVLPSHEVVNAVRDEGALGVHTHCIVVLNVFGLRLGGELDSLPLRQRIFRVLARLNEALPSFDCRFAVTD